jgi:hypothetical protein
VECWYDRLPAGVTTNVNEGVRRMKHHTAGMQFRFSTDSRKLVFRWNLFNPGFSMDHMPDTGVSGIDVYRLDERNSRWRYVRTGRIAKNYCMQHFDERSSYYIEQEFPVITTKLDI